MGMKKRFTGVEGYATRDEVSSFVEIHFDELPPVLMCKSSRWEWYAASGSGNGCAFTLHLDEFRQLFNVDPPAEKEILKIKIRGRVVK